MYQNLLRTMPVRIALAAVGLVLVLLVLFRLLSPLLVSSDLVRERMESAVEEWLGHDVVIRGTPSLSFWPRPVVKIDDIAIRQEDRPDAPILGHVTSLSARFSIWEALRGTPVFQDFTLTEPQVLLRQNQDGSLNWSSDGVLGQTLHRIGQSQSAVDSQLQLERDPVIGDISIVSGSLRIEDRTGRSILIDKIEGSLDWPRLSRSARLRIEAIANNEPVSLDVSAVNPLLLLAGRGSEVDATLQSPLVTASFRGAADLQRYAFMSGDLKISVPKVAEAVTWGNIPVHIADRLTNLSLTAKLLTIGNVLRFDQLSVAANGTKGTGVMDLAMATPSSPPRLTGTLAFDTIDLAKLGHVIASEDQTIGSDKTKRATLLERQIGLDVRFSAASAALGPVTLENAAVSIVSNASQTQIEVLDSDLFKGSLTGELTLLQVPELSTKLRIAAKDVDLASLGKALAWSSPSITGTGSLQARMKLSKTLLQASSNDVTGDFRFQAKAGNIGGLDLSGLMTLADGASYFSLQQAGQSSTSFETLEAAGRINGSSAELNSAFMVAAPYRLTLAGVIPYESRSLSLSATIEDGTRSHRLFIGGAWPNPVIWPIHEQIQTPDPSRP
ncbi:AsmA family protein [Rhizobium lemnae]|nr:AsmA-like C-terminal region-containing protein [Rhizobium lemnae]